MPQDSPPRPRPDVAAEAARPGWGLRIAAVLLLLAAPVAMALMGTPNGQSYSFNMAWMVAFEDAFGWQTPYPRYLPQLAFGLGGTDFYFYGPLPFWVAAGPARLLCPGCSVQTVFALGSGLLWAAGSLGVWGFARLLVPGTGAIVAAIVYALLPYHVGIDWMTRQAAGEFAAYAFLPLLAWGMHVTLVRSRLTALFPLGLAGLMSCHLPTALLAVHVFAAIFLAWAVTAPRAAPMAALRLGLMGSCGAALAAVYWLPAVTLLGEVSPGLLYGDPGLDPVNWLYGGPAGLVPQGLMGMLNLVSLAGAVAVVGLACWLRRDRITVIWLLVPVLLVAALNTAPAAALWNHWVIGRVQFPFRLLVFSDLAMALAAGYLAAALAARRAEGTARRTGPVVGLVVVGLVVASQGGQWAKRLPTALEKTGTEVRMTSAPEYFPRPFGTALQAEAERRGLDIWRYHRVVADWAQRFADPASGILAAAPRPDGGWHVEIPREAGSHAGGTVRVALPWWQQMRARSDTGADVPLAPGAEFGLVTAAPPDGSAALTIRIVPHWSERVGLGLTILGGVAALACGIAGRHGTAAAAAGPGAGETGERDHVAF